MQRLLELLVEGIKCSRQLTHHRLDTYRDGLSAAESEGISTAGTCTGDTRFVSTTYFRTVLSNDGWIYIIKDSRLLLLLYFV